MASLGVFGALAGLAGGDQSWVETQKLLASDGVSDERFGDDVSLDGRTLMVGAWQDNEAGQDAGAVYVFERDGNGSWIEIQKLLPSDGEAEDFFGSGLSVFGDVAVIGAHRSEDAVLDSGAVYVFERSPSGVWLEVQKLFASDAADFDRFGHAVSLYGETALVGAREDDDDGRSSGSVYVFARDPAGTWSQIQKLTASDADEFDGFGASVSLFGEVAVIAASSDEDNGFGSGSAYIFERDDEGSWHEVQKLLASDGSSGDLFGTSSAVFRQTAIVGAVGGDDNGTDSGSAYVFERDADGVWTETAKLLASEGATGDWFGQSVALSARTAIVAAERDDDNGVASGSAFVFARGADGVWAEVQKLLPADGMVGDSFGASVSLDRGTAVIGARTDDDNGSGSGSAFVFEAEGCTVALTVGPPRVRPGGELEVGVFLEHRRRESAAVPLRLWIEDEGGAVVFRRDTRELDFHYGDTLERRLVLDVRPELAAGRYRLFVGAAEMQQGVAWASREFDVIE